jgi:uncharacterized integral membrane protein
MYSKQVKLETNPAVLTLQRHHNIYQHQSVSVTYYLSISHTYIKMARLLFIFALLIAAASAFVQPANYAGEFLLLLVPGGFYLMVMSSRGLKKKCQVPIITGK